MTTNAKETDWLNSRLGKITSSNFHKLMGKGRAKDAEFSSTGYSYLYEKIAEMITGEQGSDLSGMKAIEWGNEMEQHAVTALKKKGYEFEYFGKENPKFFDYNKYSGGSPDGLNNDTVFEIKCPFNSTHHIVNLIGSRGFRPADWLKTNRIEHWTQVQFNMMCTNTDKGLLASFDPRCADANHVLAIFEIEKCNEFQEHAIKKLELAKTFIKQHIDLLDQ